MRIEIHNSMPFIPSEFNEIMAKSRRLKNDSLGLIEEVFHLILSIILYENVTVSSKNQQMKLSESHWIIILPISKFCRGVSSSSLVVMSSHNVSPKTNDVILGVYDKLTTHQCSTFFGLSQSVAATNSKRLVNLRTLES